MTQAALYARISEDLLGLGRGVDRQLADARALAEARGWTVVASHRDDDISASKGARRPGYEALMHAAQAGEVDQIVVFHTSRLWRNRAERAAAFEALAKARVSIAAVRGPDLDLASASGRLLAGILGEMDTAESEVKGERVAAAALHRAREGRANGVCAYGWRRERDLDGAGRVLTFRDIEHPEHAPVVREIVDRLLAGDTLLAITNDLNARGVPAPMVERWGKTSVAKLAVRPGNIGLRVHRGEVIGAAAWPAIVDEDKHRRVVALLADPTRRTSKGAARRHLLTFGIGECGVCGAVLAVKTRNVGRYCCHAKGCVGRQQDRVDRYVEAVVLARLALPDARDLFVADDTEARAAADKAAGLRARLAEAADQFAEGAIDGATLARISASLRPKIDDLERAASPATLELDPAAVAGILDCDRAAGTWAGLPLTRKRAVLTALGLRVRIMPTRQGPGFDPASVAIEWPSYAAS